MCSVEECTNTIYIKKAGLCRLHYNRQYHNRPLISIRVTKEPKIKRPQCTFGGCTHPAVDNDLCNKHQWDITGFKYCNMCKELLPIDRYTATGKARPGLRSMCNECRYKQNAASRARNTARMNIDPVMRATRKNSTLKRMYNITLDEFCDILYTQQRGICGFPPCGRQAPDREEILSSAGRTWHVDHDHRCCSTKDTCGKCIRGILCPNCNKLLASFWENEDNRRVAFSYLDNV